MKILSEKAGTPIGLPSAGNALRVLSKTDPKYPRLEVEELIDDRVAASSIST